MACVAVNSLVRTLELEFLEPRPRPIVQKCLLLSNSRALIQSLHQKLESLIELFDESRIDGIEAIKELERKLRDVAFGVEDEIELLIVHICELEEEDLGLAHLFEEEEFGVAGLCVEAAWPFLELCRILQKAIEDIDGINEELVKVKAENEKAKAMKGRTTTLDAFPTSDDVNKNASHGCNNKMVGKDDDFKAMIEMLTRLQEKQLKVIPIEGMGGIGKTTLARAVFEDPSIGYHFDLRAWTVASQQHNKRQMLVDLLESISRHQISDNDSDGDLALRLKQDLTGKRYLIVLDDLWNCDAWDAVKNCFTDSGNGSRVLLTTRIAEVASDICSDNGSFYQMQLLNEKESWNLFCVKACISCNAEFEMIWRPIVSKCKGLPLAIVAVAGLFSKLDTTDERNNIAEALNASATATVDEECSRILSLSYNHLPHYLKACFLYLAVFPEDEEINANELARLWSAEGLLKGLPNESYDEVAKRYIQDLKDRNLIMVSELSFCGRKIKRFRMHDMWHAVCIREAQNENLVHIVRENSSGFTKKCFRWVSFPSSYSELPENYLCRSIICFWKSWVPGFDLKLFNLIRVLHYCKCERDVNLVHLRYLNSFYLDCILRRSSGWNLQMLYCPYISSENFEVSLQPNICCAGIGSRFYSRYVNQKLQSIKWFRPRQCTKEFYTKMPNLKTVGINFYDESSDYEDAFQNGKHVLPDVLKNLGHLQLLEKLCLKNIVLKKLEVSNHIPALKNLKNLSLLNVNCKFSGIAVFCKLPRLEVLKIKCDYSPIEYGEEKWELSEESIFRKLTSLLIGSAFLTHWEANEDNFPKLERLLLIGCWSLKEVPEIPTLKLIKLETCCCSAVASAKKIQQEQLELGNNDMIVNEINTIPDGDDESSEELDE